VYNLKQEAMRIFLNKRKKSLFPKDEKKERVLMLLLNVSIFQILALFLLAGVYNLKQEAMRIFLNKRKNLYSQKMKKKLR
jgi:hypothetical protein